jgi:hypothetical protein
MTLVEETVWLTKAQAAARAQVSMRKLDEWSREPGFPVIREGKHFVRIHAERFDEWLLRRTGSTPDEPEDSSARRRRRP